MLDVSGVTCGYGDLMVLRDVSVQIDAGEFVAIVGSNAAGKTTLMRAIVGLLPLRSGSVLLEGTRIDRLKTYAIANLGLGLVLEHSALKGLSVHENLMMGAYRRAARGFIPQTIKQVYQLFPLLEERRDQPAVSLSGGEQQMLCIGRALMSQPRLLMLDEPSVGLSPALVSIILAALAELNRGGLTILLVEQNVAQTLRIASRGYVLESGRIAQSASAAALLADPSVKRAYLGI